MTYSVFKKFRNDVYKLAASYGDVVIIPPAYVEGLKALPENQLSFNEVTHDVSGTNLSSFVSSPLTWMR